jgi:hypothetical protein
MGAVIEPELPIPFDVGLLGGFRYACRPDCGLCCYAEPHVPPSEKGAVVQLVPDAVFVERGGEELLSSRPDGGACRLLSQNRCRGHAARPSVCREFPLTAHVGSRVQASVVLTCPGVELSVLSGYDGPERAGPSVGFDTELRALLGRARAAPRTTFDTGERRRRRLARHLDSEGRWELEEDVRASLRHDLPRLGPGDFPVEDPPSAEDGLERLPLLFGGRPGPIALSAALGGWELLELAAGGGVAHSLGVLPPPDRPPALTDAATRLLSGYLRYWLERDQLFGAVHLAMLESTDGPVSEWIRAELARIAALTVSRGDVLARARRGPADRLTPEEIGEGIRATDQDLLDRGSWGVRL